MKWIYPALSWLISIVYMIIILYVYYDTKNEPMDLKKLIALFLFFALPVISLAWSLWLFAIHEYRDAYREVRGVYPEEDN